MKIRHYSAILILALSSNGAYAADGVLSTMVRAYRESPLPARRTAIVNYGASHPKEAALADLALGISAYEQRDYATAIALLKPLPAQLPAIADYAAYYLAAARVESADYDGIAIDLAPTHRAALASPLAPRGWILEARARKVSAPAAGIALLREHYDELPQPEGDINLADCYQAANDLPHAAEYYQRVYYNYLTGDAAARATAALVTLKDTMGAAYPQPPIALQLRHADRLLEARDFVRAKSEYAGIASDLARVGMGVVDFQRGVVQSAEAYLRDLAIPRGEADAERLYYLVECARSRKDDGAMQYTLGRLAADYHDSPWRLRALTTAANRYLLANRPDDYIPLYRAIYQEFPDAPGAALAHWKVTFQAWMRNQPDAAILLRDHVRAYPSHASAGASLYFFGRSFERSHDYASARACYQRLATALENHYYAMLARGRLRSPEISAATESPDTARFLAAIPLPLAAPVPSNPTQPTSARIERSHLLRSAGLPDLADSELRFGARRDCQPALIAMEIAQSSDAPHQGLHLMKALSPDYLNLRVADAPRKFWELLFPLPYKSDLLRNALDRNLDPYLVAGLIRQESEFNPEAISRANAHGLTQIRPATGRQFARRAGVMGFTSRTLSQPAANLKIGCEIFKSMLEAQGGNLEQTLAAYNAGPARVAEWMTWAAYREPAEFVESIPFSETRDYVQAVLRNAEMYRRLYAR
jgi:soluble lytic murein transglycosylase